MMFGSLPYCGEAYCLPVQLCESCFSLACLHLTFYNAWAFIAVLEAKLFHDQLRPSISHHSVCSVVAARNLTPVKRDC